MKGVYVEKMMKVKKQKAKAGSSIHYRPKKQGNKIGQRKGSIKEVDENAEVVILHGQNILSSEEGNPELEDQPIRQISHEKLAPDEVEMTSNPSPKTTKQSPALTMPASSYGGPLFIWSIVTSIMGWALALVDFFLSFSGVLAFFIGLPSGVVALVLSIISIFRAFSWDYGTFGKLMAFVSLLLAIGLIVFSVLLFVGLI